MLIKRKDLEQLVGAIQGELQVRTPETLTAAVEALLMGNRLLKPRPDPVDVVPVQDYPFPINIPDVVKSCNEGPSR